MTMAGVEVESEGEEYSPYTQYLESIGLLTPGYRSPGQSYQQSLFGPINRLYGLSQRFGPATGRTPGLFRDYISEGVGRGGRGKKFRDTPGDIYGEARDILGALFKLEGEGRETMGVSFNPFYPEDSGGAAARQVSLQDQQDLFGLALRPKFGVQGARRFANRLDEEQNLWSRSGSANPWLDWLNTKYNMGLGDI
jgi:hypothetical protein